MKRHNEAPIEPGNYWAFCPWIERTHNYDYWRKRENIEEYNCIALVRGEHPFFGGVLLNISSLELLSDRTLAEVSLWGPKWEIPEL